MQETRTRGTICTSAIKEESRTAVNGGGTSVVIGENLVQFGDKVVFVPHVPRLVTFNRGGNDKFLESAMLRCRAHVPPLTVIEDRLLDYDIRVCTNL